MANQSIDPTLVALQAVKKVSPQTKKQPLPISTTWTPIKPSLNVPVQQMQAPSRSLPTTQQSFGGISSPFGATNINQTPSIGGSTPSQIWQTQSQLNTLPKQIPATGGEKDYKSLATEKEKQAFSNMLKDWLTPERASTALKYAIDKRLKEDYSEPSSLAWGIVKSVYDSPLAAPWKKIMDFVWQNITKPLVSMLPDSKFKDNALSGIESNMSSNINAVETLTPKANEDSDYFKLGKLVWDIAQTAVLPWPWWFVKGSWLLKWWLQLAKQWAVETAKYTAIAERRLPTKEELTYWVGGNVLIGWWIVWIPKILGKIKISDKADDVASKMLTNMNRITKWEQDKFAAQQWKTVWNWLNSKGIVSGWKKTIDKVAKWFVESKSKADEWLALIKWNYKNEYLSIMANEAADFAENTLSPEANKIRALAQKADDVWLTMSESNEVKRFYERNNKFTYGKDITAGEKTVRATNLDSYVRNRQLDIADQNWLTNLREINKDTQWFKYILDKLVKNEDWRLGNNAMWLTDWIVAGQIAVDPSAIGLLVWKKIASSNWFRSGVVKILNRLSRHTNEADKILDIGRIMQIQDEKQLNKFLSLPYKQDANIPTTSLNSVGGNKWAVVTPWWVNPPKPQPRTPPITVEKWAIGMWTPKVNNTPVIPPKATVAPSVSAPKNKIEHSLLQETKKYKTSDDFIEYLRTSIDDYTEWDRLTAKPKGLEKQRLDFIDYIQNKYPNKSWWASSARQYFNDVVSKNNVAPKKWMPKLWKEIMEQDMGSIDNNLIQEAKKYKSTEDFVNSYMSSKTKPFEDNIDNIENIQYLRHEMHTFNANSFYKSGWPDFWKYETIIDDVIDSMNINITNTEKDHISRLESIKSKIEDLDTDYEWYSSKDEIRVFKEASDLKEKANDIIESYLQDLEKKYISEWLAWYNDDIERLRERAGSFAPSWYARARSILWDWTNNTAIPKRYDVQMSELQLKKIREQANKPSLVLPKVPWK